MPISSYLLLEIGIFFVFQSMHFLTKKYNRKFQFYPNPCVSFMKTFLPYIYGIFFLVFNTGLSAHPIDSLKKVLTTWDSSEDSKFVEVSKNLDKTQMESVEWMAAQKDFEQLLESTQSAGDFYKLSILNALLGTIHNKLNGNEEAMQLFQTAITIGADLLSKEEQIEILKSIAELSLTMGKYDEAYHNRLQILKAYEQLEDKKGVYATLYNIGSIFFYQENFAQALKHYEESQKLAIAARDSSFIYRCLGALGSVYGELQENDKSLSHNLESLMMAEEIDYELGVAYSTHNVGLNYVILGLTEKALVHLEQSLQLMQKLGDKFGEANCLQAISNLHSQNGEHQKATQFLEQSLAIHKQLGDRSRIKEIYLDLSKAYFDSGNSVKAYTVQKGYIELRDSLIKEESRKEMAGIKQTYELEKKENEKQIALMQKEGQIEQMYRYAFLVGLGFLMLVTWLFYSRYQEQTTMNKLLAQKNEEIQLQNTKLATSNRELEQFAYIASHDLKEPLRNIGGFTSLLERRYINGADEDAKDFMRFISNSVTHMHTLLTDLLAYSRIGMQEDRQMEFFSMNQVVGQVSSNYQTAIKENQVKIIANGLPHIFANRIQMVQLFQNLIGNAIKFRSDHQPEIHIHCTQNTKEFTFSVKDNGIGMEQEYTDKIFVIFQRLHNRTKYEGTGIGLAICKKIVEQHHGRIWVESQSGKGSTFYFSIPKEQKNTSNTSTKSNRKTLLQV